MKKLIVFVLILLIGVWYKNYLDDAEKRRAQAFAQEQMRSQVQAMVQQEGANTAWEKELTNGSKVRVSPVLTAELQKAWLGGAPILFAGVVEDLSEDGDSRYKLLLEHGFVSDSHLLGSIIRLDLKCDADQILPILADAKNNQFGQLGMNVVVVASIGKIETTQERDNEGSVQVLTGVGVCKRLLFLGSNFL